MEPWQALKRRENTGRCDHILNLDLVWTWKLFSLCSRTLPSKESTWWAILSTSSMNSLNLDVVTVLMTWWDQLRKQARHVVMMFPLHRALSLSLSLCLETVSLWQPNHRDTGIHNIIDVTTQQFPTIPLDISVGTGRDILPKRRITQI